MGPFRITKSTIVNYSSKLWNYGTLIYYGKTMIPWEKTMILYCMETVEPRFTKETKWLITKNCETVIYIGKKQC